MSVMSKQPTTKPSICIKLWRHIWWSQTLADQNSHLPPLQSKCHQGIASNSYEETTSECQAGKRNPKLQCSQSSGSLLGLGGILDDPQHLRNSRILGSLSSNMSFYHKMLSLRLLSQEARNFQQFCIAPAQKLPPPPQEYLG